MTPVHLCVVFVEEPIQLQFAQEQRCQKLICPACARSAHDWAGT